MKKGITPEAAQRLAAFMKGRKAQQYNPEDWSPADAVDDILGGPVGLALLRTLSSPFWSVENDIEGVLDDAYNRTGQEFEQQFQKAIDDMNAAVSAAGYPIPDPSVWESLKQAYREKFESSLGALRQKMYDAFESTSADLAYDYQEAAVQEFQKAAGGQGQVTP